MKKEDVIKDIYQVDNFKKLTAFYMAHKVYTQDEISQFFGVWLVKYSGLDGFITFGKIDEAEQHFKFLNWLLQLDETGIRMEKFLESLGSIQITKDKRH